MSLLSIVSDHIHTMAGGGRYRGPLTISRLRYESVILDWEDVGDDAEDIDVVVDDDDDDNEVSFSTFNVTSQSSRACSMALAFLATSHGRAAHDGHDEDDADEEIR